MEFNFGYLFQFSDWFEDEENKSALDKFYKKLDIELRSYVDHLLKSLDAYSEQERRSKDDLILTYPNYTEINNEFNRLFDIYFEETGGDSQLASQVAYRDSGKSEMDQDIHYAIDDINNTFHYIRDTFLKSSLLYLYSILEAHLRELCIILKDETNSNLDISELSNRNYLDTCYVYLSKVIGLDIGIIEPHENTLKDFQNLRNVLVHDFGIVSSAKKVNQIQKILNSYDGSKLEANKFCINSSSILVTFLQSIIMTFQDLYWIIDNKFGHKMLNRNISKGIQFLSKNLSASIIDVQFNSGLSANSRFRNKTIDFDIILKQKKIIARGRILIKTHKSSPSLKVKLEKPLVVSKTLLANYNSLIKISRERPNTVISNVFRNFYLTQKLSRKVEVIVRPV